MKKILFGIASLGLVALVGAGFGQKSSHMLETKADNPTVTSVKLAGSFTDWATSAISFTNNGGTWELNDIDIEMGQSFKIVVNNSESQVYWCGQWTLNGGDAFTSSYFYIPTEGDEDDNIYVSYAGTYSFSFTPNAEANYGSLTISGDLSAYRAKDSYTAGDTIYLQPKDAWSDKDVLFAFKFINADGSKAVWGDYLSTKTHQGIYKYVVPAGVDFDASKIVVGRFNPDGATTPSSDTPWNTTGELTASKVTNCVWLPDTVTEGGGFYAYNEVVYSLSVSGVSYPMTLYAEDTSQVYADIPAAAKGDLIQVIKDAGPAEDIEINAETMYGNNIDGDNRIKVGGSIRVFYKMETNIAWATGYAPSTTTLQNFCEYLLSQTITAGSCSVSGSVASNLENMYKGTYGDASYNLTATDRTTFNSILPNLGNSVSYASMVEEAMTRYCRLVSGGELSDFAGINPAAATFAPLDKTGNEHAWVIIGLTGIVTLVSGAFILARKRRAE